MYHTIYKNFTIILLVSDFFFFSETDPLWAKWRHDHINDVSK